MITWWIYKYSSPLLVQIVVINSSTCIVPCYMKQTPFGSGKKIPSNNTWKLQENPPIKKDFISKITIENKK